MNKPSIAFFGTPEPAVEILEWLDKAGLTPTLVVTNPDKPQGRNLAITPSPAKVWAEAHDLDLFQPEKLDEDACEALIEMGPWDLFIVVAYGKIIPQAILDIPAHGSLNVHYSLLPKYRGASPIESHILADDKHPGISIMLLDSKMDQGPLLGTAPVEIAWPPTSTELREASNKVAGKLLVELIPKFLEGKITPVNQDHAQATYTKKFTKADAEINLSEDPYKNFLKIQALNEWQPYFFAEKNGKKIRIIIKKATFQNGTLEIFRVVPEGKKEMDFKDYQNTLHQ